MKKKSVWALALAAMLMWVGKPAVAAVNKRLLIDQSM